MRRVSRNAWLTSEWLAFVAISHSGLMLLAIGLLNPLGLAGFALFACGDGAVKASLFALDAPRQAAADSSGAPPSRRAATLLLLAGLALAGMPPAVTYLAKGLTESGTGGGGRILLSGVVLVVSALTGGAVVRLALPGLRQPRGEESGRVRGVRSSTARASAIAAAVLVAGAFSIGFVPGIARASLDAATRFTNRRSYAAVVLRGRRPPAAATTTPNLDPTAVALGAAAALGALAVGCLGAGRVFGSSAAAAAAPTGAPLTWLRRLHAGRVTDSAAWITFGTAAIAAALAAGVR